MQLYNLLAVAQYREKNSRVVTVQMEANEQSRNRDTINTDTYGYDRPT